MERHQSKAKQRLYIFKKTLPPLRLAWQVSCWGRILSQTAGPQSPGDSSTLQCFVLCFLVVYCVGFVLPFTCMTNSLLFFMFPTVLGRIVLGLRNVHLHDKFSPAWHPSFCHQAVHWLLFFPRLTMMITIKKHLKQYKTMTLVGFE